MLAAEKESYDLDPAIPFEFGWEEIMATALAFAVFNRVYLLDSPWNCMGGLVEEKARGGGEASFRP